METTLTLRPKMKYKTFTYHTQLGWVGDRAGTLRSDGKPEFRVASPPEFKGEEGVWTPEDLFVAAVDSCTMTTFMAFAQRQELPIVSYTSETEGVLEFVDGGYEFTKVTLRPKILVATDEAVEQAEKTLHDAHKKCLVANSVRSTVVVEPRIERVHTD